MKDKTYILIFSDRKNNELTRKYFEAKNIRKAREVAFNLISCSMMQDLQKISVKLKK